MDGGTYWHPSTNRCNCAMILTLTAGLTVIERPHGTYINTFIEQKPSGAGSGT
jgi:hypothetical protein